MNLIKQFHSLPSFYLLLLISCGITISWHIGTYLNFNYLVILFSINSLIVIFLYNKNSSFFYFCGINFILAGLIYGWFCLFTVSEKESHLFAEDIKAFQGTIIQIEERAAKKNTYVMKCEKIMVRQKMIAAEGLIQINQGKYKGPIHFGDRLRISGKPQFPPLPTNPGEFNYRKFLQLNKKFFYFQMKEETKLLKISVQKGNWFQSIFFNPVRHNIRSAIDTYLFGNSAAIVKALVLGDKGSLDKDIVSDFQKTGVIHVLAISGLHVGFIALILQFLLSLLRMPKKMAMAFVILFLLFFVALVNFKAPVVRASLMMTVYYVSKFTMRPQNPLNTIALAAIIILLVNPQQLFLPGFQYSFSAVFGLTYGNSKLIKIIPLLSENTQLRKLVNNLIIKPFISSLSAILATVPLTWYYFGTIQVGALVANIFIIPLIGFVVLLSIIFLLFSIFSFLPAAGVSFIIDFLIIGMIETVSFFSAIPFVQIATGHPSFISLSMVSIAIYLLFNLSNSKSKKAFIYLVLFALIIRFLSYTKTNKLLMTFIHVGQGDATLLQFPNGKTALIDAGNKGFGFDAGKRYVDPVLKYYGINKINYLIGSHPHSDHIGGFDFIMSNYLIDTLVFNNIEVNSGLYQKLLKKAKRKNIAFLRLDSGDILPIDRQVRFYVLHPSDNFENVNTHSGSSINNSSLVFKLVHGKNRILFTGDAEMESEHALLNYKDFLECDLLKVGHHGSKTSSSLEFLNFVKPDYAIISVGKNNKFKHPSFSTLSRYAQLAIPAFRTDLNGALVFESDGRNLARVIWRK